ncbi:hypothetical protein BDW68DRAFT_184740 [Aspergillus falconensis]
MPPKVADDSKQRTTTRRKVALACDSCREKKVRCDGNKPISGPCMRRAYRIDQCVYNTDNARSASRDEYFQTICQRIRELEDACLRAGVSIDSSPGPQARRELLSEPNGHSEIPVQAGSPSLTVPHDSAVEEATEWHITGMGQILALDDESRRQSSRFQIYGSSSTASLMRFAWQSMPSRPANASCPERMSNTLQDTFMNHLVSCFFDHVYTLYPFFHRPAFEATYRNLWRAGDEPEIPLTDMTLTDMRIGLGSGAESGPKSILFHAALNSIFSLGCQSADIVPEEVEFVANSFFLRAKRFIGLDLLDINTRGVVQTLLIAALFLQSSPYPSRCWHSIGVACRSCSYSCTLSHPVLIYSHSTLSMTYGRPTMTTHLAPLPSPDASDTSGQDGAEDPSLMAFYTEAIELYSILDRLLSDLYYAWHGRSPQDQPKPSTKSPGYIHLHLLLHRPIFTRLYSKRVWERETSLSFTTRNTLYSSPAATNRDLTATKYNSIERRIQWKATEKIDDQNNKWYRHSYLPGYNHKHEEHHSSPHVPIHKYPGDHAARIGTRE